MGVCRSPRGGRGLKLSLQLAGKLTAVSPSSRRAWIEITPEGSGDKPDPRRPPRGGRELKRSPHRYVAWHRPPPVPGPFGAGGRAFTGKKKTRCISAPCFFFFGGGILNCRAYEFCFSALSGSGLSSAISASSGCPCPPGRGGGARRLWTAARRCGSGRGPWQRRHAGH